jgi:photosystem II cytochrome c550
MFRRSISIVIASIFTASVLAIGGANPLKAAQDLSEADRTVPLNSAGATVVVTMAKVNTGRRLFNATCGECHAGGRTKTNEYVSLSPGDLADATPSRNNVEGLVDYMKNPTTYDGKTEISEIHPSMKSTAMYPKMRNLTDDDLTMIAGYILVQARVSGNKWGGTLRFIN